MPEFNTRRDAQLYILHIYYIYILYICIWTTRIAINTLIVCLELDNVNRQIELKLIDARFVSITKQTNIVRLQNLCASNFDFLCLRDLLGLFQYWEKLSTKGKFLLQLQWKLPNYKNSNWTWSLLYVQEMQQRNDASCDTLLPPPHPSFSISTVPR